MNSLDPDLAFTSEEIDLLGQTADALTAYMGKPVLAEIMGAEDTGAEWVAFGIPLGVDDEIDEEATVIIQLGGPDSRYAGNRGGLGSDDTDAYSCECLWIIQLSDDDAGRYVKVDPLTQDCVFSDDLRELLPFEVGAAADQSAASQNDQADDNDDVQGDTASNQAEEREMDKLIDQLQSASRRLH